MSGDTQDDGARTMSGWMDRRLQQIEHAGRLIRAGVPVEDAYGIAAKQGAR